jgi:hypothetical protein
MGGQKSLRFVFVIALVVGVVLTVTTWAAPPKPQSVSAAVAKGAIYRPHSGRCTKEPLRKPLRRCGLHRWVSNKN